MAELEFSAMDTDEAYAVRYERIEVVTRVQPRLLRKAGIFIFREIALHFPEKRKEHKYEQ